MVRYVLRVSLCALMLSSVSVLGACGDDDGGSADGDDGDDTDDGDDGGDEPDAGEECDHLVGCPIDAGGDVVQEATFTTLPEPNPIAGSAGTLTRNAEGFTAEVTVPGMIEGNVYTFWWVFYQNPEECLFSPTTELKCNPMDLPVGTVDPNHVIAVQSALVYGSGDTLGGMVVGADSTFTLTREYATNTDPTLGLFPGTNPPPAGYWDGITDSLKAEVHLAVRDHGPEGNGGLTLEEQAGSFNSPNCNPRAQQGPVRLRDGRRHPVSVGHAQPRLDPEDPVRVRTGAGTSKALRSFLVSSARCPFRERAPLSTRSVRIHSGVERALVSHALATPSRWGGAPRRVARWAGSWSRPHVRLSRCAPEVPRLLLEHIAAPCY